MSNEKLTASPGIGPGLVGLGVMGAALAENLSAKGYAPVVFDRDDTQAKNLAARFAAVRAAGTLSDLCAQLPSPRVVLLLVPAGDAVDETIDALLESLTPGDTIVDLGNSHWADTDRRYTALLDSGMFFVGSGISGGEEGARHGPAMMPGGDERAWPALKPILQSLSAHVGDQPCCDWLGRGGAGHYVKMVHNGIEYGDMQIISESYDLMHRGLQMTHEKMSETFSAFNQGPLESYLMDISIAVFDARDDAGNPLLETVLDAAGQKGTGKWTGISALELGVPVSLINESVFARCVSALVDVRASLSDQLGEPDRLTVPDPEDFLNDLESAMLAARIVSYAQGFMLLDEASREYGWDLAMARIARLWRGGCIIRSALLDPIADAFESERFKRNAMPTLLNDPWFAKTLEESTPALRRVVSRAVLDGLPVPCFASTLSFIDAMRSRRLPANMLQALRDCFGAHTYERVDRPRGEFFHSNWQDAD